MGRLNFSSSSSAHCLRSDAGQITSSRRLRSAQNWQSTMPASIVFPRPTSSARITPLESGDCRANSAASIWCGLRSTAASNSDMESRSMPLAARRVRSWAKYLAW